MPEIPTTKIGFIKEGVKYLLRLPLIELTCLTGKPFLKPFSAGIVVTNKCNLNCLFCFVNKEVEVIDKLTKDEHITIIDFLADWGVKQITFSGGFTVKKEHLSMLDKNLDKLKKLKRRQRIMFNQDIFFELLKSYYRDNTYINRRYKKGAYGISFMMNRVVGFCGSFLKLGNIRDRTPEEIWKSQEFTTARIEMRKCKKCLLNCHYTPPLWDLIKDFGVYPILRKLYFR